MKKLDDFVNPGARPSRLDLGRLDTGEIQGEEAERLRARAEASPEASAWLQDLAAARSQVQPFDAEILRKRAARIADGPKRAPVARRGLWRWSWLPALAAVAAVALVLVQPPANRAKGESDLDFYVLREGLVHPGVEEEIHQAGDRIQFTYRSVEASTLVLLSVDGRGSFNVFYPAQGDVPEAVIPGDRRVLADSIQLDDAPDFELFLAFFGVDSVAEAMQETESLYAVGGVEGLLELAQDDPLVDAIYIRKAGELP